MIGESVGCSQQQRHLGRRPLRKCKNRVEESNVVFIDVESDSFENVVIIDSPKSLPTKNGDDSERFSRGNKVRSLWKGVILLDDDEDMNADFVGAGVKSGRNFKNGASTSSKSNTSSGNFGSPSTAKINGYKFVQENESPINLSSGKRTYSGKATRGNRFGGDYPDCELMEDSFGSVKEQWEKACSKRRRNLQNDQLAQGHSNKDTADTNKNSNVAKDCGQFEETPAVSKQAEDEAAGSFIHNKKGNAVLMMGDREKLKQTDEYKKTLEEELASRQRALQVQSEEAQKLRRLRKRMKAEAARLLDMERRQKERVEEIRETQKKDEKNSDLKEIVRGEVRNDLKKLELTCRDMASLLQGLGIPVGGGLHPPLSSEVHSAYKRALLAFHPDRASRSDVRQQVEAEEKFKLISRMKEKFMPL